MGMRCVRVCDMCGCAMCEGVLCAWVCDACGYAMCVGMRCVWVCVCGRLLSWRAIAWVELPGSSSRKQ